MMTELKELIGKGGSPVFNTYAVEIGDALWSALYDYLEKTFPRDLEEGEEDCYRCSKYFIDSVWEEDSQKFAILRERSGTKFFRLNFTWGDNGFNSDNTLTEVEKTYVPVAAEPVFVLEDVENFEKNRYNFEDNSDKDTTDKIDNTSEGDNENEPQGQEAGEPEDHEGDNKLTYSLDDIPEYTELMDKFSALQNDFDALKAEKESLEAKIAPLAEFKANAEKKDKQDMIDSFYMLSDEDKADVIKNIDTYSLDDIEAKLSIICVRNKVNFNLDEDNTKGPTVFNLNSSESNDASIPAWVKAAIAVSEKKN